ncbi:MAG TPA: YhdH/YhfP family quinone oxidoreductase [Pirellulales bacterium]|jgi:putative YhdH/YhfP family quinone oxidoreductase|nr:YhdH/YhfP family quinone oxidoreductase [Pirellulales bacterium]HEX4143511.1 YhdH/YhfP family quinone oxidoreductase [Pirellulales bacterium]
MVPQGFDCYLVEKDGAGKFHGRVARKSVVDLPAGEVLVRISYSSLNYKDALSATGHPGVTRKFPHVPGIDAAGVVEESHTPLVEPGDEVFITGFDLGQNTWGGFAQYVRVPGKWIMPLPEGLTLREVMIYGTAGLTAGQCVEALQKQGIQPGHGEVVVTGASGGVGSLAVGILAKAGYQVVASSGKPAAHTHLTRLGARRIISREEVSDTTQKPMLPPRWAAAIDTVGGQTLSTLVRSLEHGGAVAACGLVGGVELGLTVYPFILRNVSLLGIDSVECPLEARTRIWHKLAGEWKPKQLDAVAAEEVGLDELNDAVERILAGKTVGRVVVDPQRTMQLERHDSAG